MWVTGVATVVLFAVLAIVDASIRSGGAPRNRSACSGPAMCRSMYSRGMSPVTLRTSSPVIQPQVMPW